MSSRIAGLEHLRALAIVLVFLFHYRLFPHPDWVDTLGLFGWTGVDLFFVLSGYLIAAQIFREQQEGRFSLKRFYLKRALRILPAFYMVLGLYYLVPAFREWGQLPPPWKMLSFTQNLGLDLRLHRCFSHAWSLCIEEQFYLLLPLTLILLMRFRIGKARILLLPFLLALGVLARYFSWQWVLAPQLYTDHFGALWYQWIYYPSYNRLDGLLAGIGLAAATVYMPKAGTWLAAHSGRLAMGGGLVLVVAYLLCAETPQSFAASVWGFPLLALGFGLLVAATASPLAAINYYGWWLSSWIARLSYALYLSHKAAIHAGQAIALRLGLDADGTLAFWMSVLMSLLFAGCLHYVVELPFLKWKEQLLRKRELRLATVTLVT